jgi:nucleoside phosphorylase/tetratricopeptide (TPR) repeat protein
VPKEILKADEAPAFSEGELKPLIGIVAALPHEFAAVKVLLESPRPIFVPGRGAGRQYLYGELPAPNGGKHSIVLALPPDTGNNLASARAALLLNHFPSVHTIIMSGIAGGVPHPDKSAEHVRLGDIVVSNRDGVVQYDFGKEELEDGKVKITPRHPPRAPSASLIETARLLQAGEMEGERPWERYIAHALERLSAARPPAETDVLASSTNPEEVIPHPVDPKRVKDLPRVFMGPIASSNTLLKNPVKRDQLRDSFGVKAVEMEGSGIADAAWTGEAQYLVIRGVCDYCDKNKGDDWQVYAAIVAAAYSRALLEATPAVSASPDVADGGRNIQIDGDVNNSVIVSGDYNQITINSNPTALTPTEPGYGTTFNVVSSQLDSVARELSDDKSDKLEELRESFREGSTKDAYDGVQKLRQSSNWPAFSNRLRAAILRALAVMTLSLKGTNGITEAEAIAQEASQIEPNEDDVTLRTRIKVVAEGYATALDDLTNPSTLDAYNLRLGLLLETGKIQEALNELHNPPRGINFDAETYRLFALALLASKDIQGAQKQIGKALAERSRRLYIRYTAAVIDYFSALSPLALPPHLVSFPRPVQLSMVKMDAESRERLLRAANEFKEIGDLTDRKSEERMNIGAWRSACIANLPDRQADAVELCKERLTEDPGDARILSWALFRHYEIDLSSSLQVLEQRLEESDGSQTGAKLEELLALIGIHLRQGTYKEALAFIEKKRNIFNSADELDLWWYWRGQLLIADGQAETALEESSHIEEQSLQRTIRTIALCAISDRSGDWEPVFSYLEKNYEEENDIGSLLTLCELKAQQKDWPYVADRAELYCNAIGTPASARFVIAATWYSKRPGKCLQLLNQYEPLFPNGKLPADLRKLRVHCLINTSDIKGALSEAESLAQDNPTVESIMLLMDVQLTKGDLTGLEVSARDLLRRTDLTSEQLLRAAHLVKLNNPSLAKKFWLQAVESAAEDPQLTAFAIDMAARLGLENQRGSLMQRMMEYAEQGQGPMKVMNMEQALEIMREGREQQEQLEQMYASGEAPLHALAKGGLAQVFRGLAEFNRTLTDNRSRRRIYIRHGGRTLLPIDYIEQSKTWRLYCDITSLLLVHELGVLEQIEKLFKPLRISRHLTTALIAQRDKLKPHQKAQLDESHAVLEMLSKGKFHVLDEELPEGWKDEVYRLIQNTKNEAEDTGDLGKGCDADDEVGQVIHANNAELEQQLGHNRLMMLAAALAQDGIAVGLLPLLCYGLTQHAVLKLPESLSNIVVNCRAIADSLRGSRRITDEAYEGALRSLGVEGILKAAASPLIGSKLFLMEGVADLLARANLLERVCSNFDVTISSSCVKEAENTVQHYERLAKIETWLNELINRISDGLDEGTYEFISISDERMAERDDQEEKLSQEFTTTLDLFLFEPQEGDVLWVDDRAINKYPLRGGDQIGVPIIGINEVLLALWTQGELDENEYYDLLLRLRESNFRYVPLDDGEILHHLRQARIENGRVVETDALATLRQYFASCLLDKDNLQLTPIGNNTPHQHSELPFVVQIINSTANAIAEAWLEDGTNVETAKARANWILNNLYIGNYGCSHLRKDEALRSSIFSAEKLVALDMCNLLMRGIGMHGNPLIREDKQRRNHYFDWLINQVISTRYGSSPEVIKATAKEMQERFEILKGQVFSSQDIELFTQAFLGKFFLDLPDIISNEMELDAETIEWLQVKIGSIATVSGINFPLHDYWKATEKTLSEGIAIISSIDTETEYRLVKTVSDDKCANGNDTFPAITLIDSDGNQVEVISDPTLGLLLPDVQGRRAALEKLRKWFDCGQKEFEEEADTLSSIEDVVTRATRLHEWRTRSTELYYSSLDRRFRANESVSWSELLPPSAESLAGRFRLPPILDNESFTEIWKESASALLREEDLLGVIARCSSLPVPLPQEVIQSVSLLTDDERLKLLERLAASWTSPLRQLHLINLALRSAPTGDNAAIEIARSLLAKLYDEDNGKKDFNAFQALLVFFNEEFHAWKESGRLSPEIKLAMIWAHACRIHNLFHYLGYSPADILSTLENGKGSYFREALVRDVETWKDCSHPKRLNRTRFLTHSVAKMLAGIDLSILEELGLPELIRKEVFREISENQKFPDVSLLSDPTLYQDALLSILGGDRHAVLAQIIGPDGIEILLSENLRQNAQKYLDELLRDPSQVINWAGIQMVTDDLPIYDEFRDQCRRALETFDPFTAREEGFRQTSLVFRAAAYQVTHLEDEGLRQRFRGHLLELLKSEVTNNTGIAADGEFNSLERRIVDLIDIASILSNVPSDLVASNREFTSLLDLMSEQWPDFGSHYGRILSREVWNIPIAEGESWWHLILKLRSSKL